MKKTTRAPRATTVEERPEALSEIMTLREVAEYLACSRNTIYRLATKRQIPRFRVGNNFRFRRSDIEQWINDRRVTPEDAGEHEDKPKGRPPKFWR
jgi:excisionase family DNA binding protein